MTTDNFSLWTTAPEDPRPRMLRAPVQKVDELVEVDVVEDDPVAWLVIVGKGTWGYADKNATMRTFDAGLHHVGQETVDFALRAPSGRVFVTAEKPVLTRRQMIGPLIPEDYNADGVKFQTLTTGETPEEDDTAVAFAHHCRECPRKFPSSQALARHVANNH